MTSESTVTSAMPPPQEEPSVHQPPPQNPVNSATISVGPPPSQPEPPMDATVNINGVVPTEEEPPYYNYFDSKEYAENYKRYEADFRQYLIQQYFSGKDPNGVVVYEESTTVDGQTIMSSKWPCTRVYADLDVSYVEPVEQGEDEEEEEEGEVDEEEEESVDSPTAEIVPGEISNGGTTVSEKNSSS